MDGNWRSGEVLAWTEREGPGRPPAGPPRWVSFGLTAVLGVAFLGLVVNDSLCEQHRMWIETLAGVAIIGVVLALVGMVRGWSSAPLVIVVSGAAGVAIGVIDAVHAPTRGWTVASAFGLAVIGAAWLGVVQYRLRRWDRTLQAAVTDSLPEPAGIASFSAVEPIGIEPEVSDAAVEP